MITGKIEFVPARIVPAVTKVIIEMDVDTAKTMLADLNWKYSGLAKWEDVYATYYPNQPASGRGYDQLQMALAEALKE